jgi:hypothetical protein
MPRRLVISQIARLVFIDLGVERPRHYRLGTPS